MWLHLDSVLEEERSQYWFSYSTEKHTDLCQSKEIPGQQNEPWDSALSVAVGLKYVILHIKFGVELISVQIALLPSPTGDLSAGTFLL